MGCKEIKEMSQTIKTRLCRVLGPLGATLKSLASHNGLLIPRCQWAGQSEDLSFLSALLEPRD